MERLVLTRTQRRQILDALKSSPLFDTLDGRTLLLRDLPQVLSDSVHRDATTTVDLDNIVETAHAWGSLSDGTPALLVVLDNARYLTQGSETGQALNALYEELTTARVDVAPPLPGPDLSSPPLSTPPLRPRQNVPPPASEPVNLPGPGPQPFVPPLRSPQNVPPPASEPANLPGPGPQAFVPPLPPSPPPAIQPRAAAPLPGVSASAPSRIPLLLGGAGSALILALLLFVFIANNNNGNQGGAHNSTDPNKQPTVILRPTPTTLPTAPPRISLDALKRMYDDPAQRPMILDVRVAESYVAGHIAGAISFPEADVDSRIAELPKDKFIVAYCQ